MADSKISALTGATTPLAGTEVVPVVQSGITKKVAVSDLTAGRAVYADTLTLAGATPSAWSGIKGIQASTGAAFTGSSSASAYATSNAYYDGGSWRYITASYATQYRLTGSNGQHVWFTAGSGAANALVSFTQRMSLEPTGGDLTLNTGNLVIGTSGKGIDFSADGQAAGMTSELLDDYEEGTWTPVFATGSGAFGANTYDVQSGTYTKIGRVCIANFSLRSDVITPGTATNVAIGGLPFTSSTDGCSGGISYAASFAGDMPSAIGTAPSQTNAYLYYRSAANGATLALDVSDLGTGANANWVKGTVVYIAA